MNDDFQEAITLVIGLVAAVVFLIVASGVMGALVAVGYTVARWLI